MLIFILLKLALLVIVSRTRRFLKLPQLQVSLLTTDAPLRVRLRYVGSLREILVRARCLFSLRQVPPFRRADYYTFGRIEPTFAIVSSGARGEQGRFEDNLLLGFGLVAKCEHWRFGLNFQCVILVLVWSWCSLHVIYPTRAHRSLWPVIYVRLAFVGTWSGQSAVGFKQFSPGCDS